jgi:hypothetical protein
MFYGAERWTNARECLTGSNPPRSRETIIFGLTWEYRDVPLKELVQVAPDYPNSDQARFSTRCSYSDWLLWRLICCNVPLPGAYKKSTGPSSNSEQLVVLAKLSVYPDFLVLRLFPPKSSRNSVCPELAHRDPLPCLCAQRASSRNEPEHQNDPPTSVDCFSATTWPNYMRLSLVNNKINAKNLYYLNFSGSLMLRPFLVTVGRGAGSGSPPTSPPLTPDAPPPEFSTTCFFWRIFVRGFEAFLFKFWVFWEALASAFF